MILSNNMKIRGLKTEILLAVIAAEGIYLRYGVNLRVTSFVRDPNPNSLHDEGLAVDFALPSACEKFREADLPPAELDQIVLLELREALGAHYDVVDERKPIRNPPPPGWGPHYHVEYDPHAPARG